MRSWAVRHQVEKSSISASILEAKTRPKSIKTEVPKRIEKRTPPGNDFFRFSTDFGRPGRPPGLPKSPEIRLLGPPEPAPGLTGTRFGRFWAETLSCDGLGDAIWTVLGPSGTDFSRILDDVQTFLERFCDAFMRGTHSPNAVETPNLG